MRTLLILSLLLASCGGGGGTAGDGAPGAARGVPGGSISVRAEAGAVTVSTTVPGVASIDVLSGADYGTAVPVGPSTAGPGAWHGSGISGGILIRLTLDDGSIIESAPGDFMVR